MTLNDVLLSLLEPMRATGETHLIAWDTVQQWPVDALSRMLEAGILTRAMPAQSVECQSCENRCFVEIQYLPCTDKRPSRAIIVCDDPEMQSQMGCIQIPQERLQQWKVTAFQLAEIAASLLTIESKAEDRHGQTNFRIGMIKGKSGRRWLSLNKSPLTLEINDYRLAFEEVLFFEGDTLTIDRDRIDHLVNKASGSTRKKYTQSTDMREAQKRKTEAMYEDWREAYQRLRREYPNNVSHTDIWVSRQIAKLDIAKGKSSETIRRRMKG